MQLLQPRAGGRYIDATVGGAGHAERLLELSSPDGLLLGIDADPAAIAAASERLERFGSRVALAESYFDRLQEIARDANWSTADAILLDLGVSSPQLEKPERGFTFQHEAPLDMRYGPQAEASAAELIEQLPAEELEDLFRAFGEERYARRIARRIVTERQQKPIKTTQRLAEIVEQAKPRRGRERIHPATRIFQALRIAVNDELSRLRRVLPQAVDLLEVGGRLAVISFHSLEDRIVKQFLRAQAKGCTCPPELPQCVCGREPTVRILTRRPVRPSPEDVAANPRARSARLRAAERTDAPLDSDSTSDGSA